MSIDDLKRRMILAIEQLGGAFDYADRELREIAELVTDEDAKSRILALAAKHREAADVASEIAEGEQ